MDNTHPVFRRICLHPCDHLRGRTARRGRGIVQQRLAHLNRLTDQPVLIGTWRTATRAIRFYEKNGFALLDPVEKNHLLKRYWTVPDRQIEESVAFADQRWLKRSIS